MHRAFCIFVVVVAGQAAGTKAKWSKEIPSSDSESPLTRERRQFNVGDWIPLTQPCVTCRPLTDSADTGNRQDDIGLTPPRPPTVTRQIHKSSFFPQDESSILSVPPPPVFTRNQISNGNLQSARFPNFLQQFNSPNSLQFDTQPVFPQAQFLSQPFLGSTSLLGSNYPQVLPLLNNPSALLVQGNLNSAQEIKTPKIGPEAKVPNLQENVIIEQNRQHQHHQVKNQQVEAPAAGLQLPLKGAPVDFAPNRQQQSIIEGNILTPPPVPNSTFPDIIIPGLDKEEIQLLYVPLETLKQRTHHHHQQQQQQPKQQQQHHQQQQLQIQQHHQQQQLQIQHQVQQAQQHHQQQQLQIQQHQAQQPQQHHQQQQLQIQQHQVQQPQQHHQQQQFQIQQHEVQQPQQVQKQHALQQQQQNHVRQQQQHVLQQQNQAQQQKQQQQRVTPTPPTIKFTQQQSVRAEHPTTPQPAGHFITHSATPAPHTVSSTFSQAPVTPSTLFFQHLPFQPSQSPVVSSTPENPTLHTFVTPSPLTQKFSAFPSVTPTENLVTISEKHPFTQEFVTTPKTAADELTVKGNFGKEELFDDVQLINKFKSFSIQQQEEQQRQILLQQQEEQEKQKLLRQEYEQKLLLEQQQRERTQQEKLFREQQEREKQEKLLREQQEQERKQKLIKEQQERERQQKLLFEQQERERQQKILLEQQARERQQKIVREQQERERQQQKLREQQERERQQKIYREQQERERKQKILLEQQQERERQQKIAEQQEKERQQKIFREQQERELKQKLLLEQQERERQEQILREQQERERQEQILREQLERERQEQQRLFEQQERERQEERRQKELLRKQQQEHQLLLQEQQEREQQLLLNQQQQYLIQQQQQLVQPVPTQFDLQPQGEPTVSPLYDTQTEIPDESLVPHQPPLSVFYGGSKGQSRVADVLKELRGAKTIAVLDQYLDDIPRVFVGPANLRAPKGYGKFELPYLSNIDVSRVERKVDRLPFFVAPLNFIPPTGYSKIPFPAPHVGSVVVSSESVPRPGERGSTSSPNLSTLRSTLHPRLRLTTQPPPTTHIQQIHPKTRLTDTRLPNELLPDPEQINELRTEGLVTTTTAPETTTQARTRRPYYRTKVRRPGAGPNVQGTRRPETVENAQAQKSEAGERKPAFKYPKQRRQRVKTTTEGPEFDSVNSANRQFLVETSPTPATQKHFGDSGDFIGEFAPPEGGRTEVQGLFEVDTHQERNRVEQQSTETVANADVNAGTQSPLTTVGLEAFDHSGFGVTTPRPSLSTAARFEPTQKVSSTIDYARFGQTDYFVTTQRVPASVEIENAGITGFYDQTPRIPVGIESNGDSGFYSKTSFSSTGGDNAFYVGGQIADKGAPSGFGKQENAHIQEGSQVHSDSSDGRFYEQQQVVTEQKQRVVPFEEVYDAVGAPKQEVAGVEEQTVRTTPKASSYETNSPSTELATEAVRQTTPFPVHESLHQRQEQKVHAEYVETEKENEEVPPTTTQAPATRVKSRFRTKSRGQVNFASSQTSTQSPYVRKRIVYKSRKEEPEASAPEEVKAVPKYRGQRKGHQTSTESAYEYDGSRTVYTAKPQRRSSVPVVYRRRKPVTSPPATTSENYPPHYEIEYSPSGVSNDVFDDQIRESSLSRSQYAENAVTYTATTTTTTTTAAATTPAPVTAEEFGRRRDGGREEYKTEEIPTENYPASFKAQLYASRVTAAPRPSSTIEWDRSQAEEDVKKTLETKKAFDPSLEKKNARRRILVRVHKRPHEQIETAESQNFGTVANALVPPTSAKPSAEPDLYRFSKSGFNFDQSDKFAGTKNQAYVRNITSDILENTAAFSAPGVESEPDVKRVTIVNPEKLAATMTTTAEYVPETTERADVEEERTEESKEETREEAVAETTTENAPVETTTYFTTAEDSETETEEPTTTTTATSTSTTTTTTTTTTTPSTTTTTEEDASREIQMSTATEISHETEICFRGKCIKTNSATADEDLRKLVQSADKVLIT